MSHVAICLNSPPPEVLDALREALAETGGVRVEDDTILLEGTSTPDRVQALVDRALGIAGHLRLAIRCVEDTDALAGEDTCGAQ